MTASSWLKSMVLSHDEAVMIGGR